MPDRNDLDEIVRFKDGKSYHGYGLSQAREKIKQGLLPKPFSLSPGGRAKAWTKRQLLEHQRRRIADSSDDCNS
jgi:predicted DNA-binding transcriptional regulator AlpA